MSAAFLLMALGALLLGLSLFGQQDTEAVIVLRILGILCAFAAVTVWSAG